MAETTSFNKLLFFRDLGYTPHPGQIEIHRSPAPRRIVACGVRWGKTRCAAMEGIAAAMEPREQSMGWVVAPTYDLADKVFRELVVIAAEHLRHRIVALREGERRLLLRNLAGGISEIRGKSADNPISLLGEGLDWLIVDEASRLKPSIWEGHLSQRLIDRQGWALLISTPKGRGWFHDLYLRGQRDDPHYASWNAPSWQNPHLDRKAIEAERDRLPERVFRQEYAAEFMEGSGAVFRNVRECATGEWQEPQPRTYYVGGLDLAKVQDYTVLTVSTWKQHQIVFIDRFHRIDWDLQIKRIRAQTLRYRNPKLFVDSTGKGEPIYESLKRADIQCADYPFTQKSKAALIDNAAIIIERGDVILPKPSICPELIDELESFQYSVTEAGNVRTGAPSGSHDDLVISLALALWHFRPQPVRFARYTQV